MDNGVVVAISSFASAVVAGGITLISKLLDTIQKSNEQRMIITNTYITKKIEAGQRAVASINVTIQKFHTEVNYLKHLKEQAKPSDESIDNIIAARKAVTDLAFTTSDFTDLYFNITELLEEEGAIAELLNARTIQLNKVILTEDRTKYLADINEIIALLNHNIKIYNRMNAKLRNELSKYDIL